MTNTFRYPHDDNDKWDAFVDAKTGYPFIDAGMRQLYKEGWIHHIVRNALACFLTRGDLWISWEAGLKIFLENLLDADWSVCAGNWMWISSSAFEQVRWPSFLFKQLFCDARFRSWIAVPALIPPLMAGEQIPGESISKSMSQSWPSTQSNTSTSLGRLRSRCNKRPDASLARTILSVLLIMTELAKRMPKRWPISRTRWWDTCVRWVWLWHDQKVWCIVIGFFQVPLHCAPSDEKETREFMSLPDECCHNTVGASCTDGVNES